jgi:aminoglycoside phosphotransferase (APT) family kinase protein
MEPVGDNLRSLPNWLAVLADPATIGEGLAGVLRTLVDPIRRVEDCRMDRVRLGHTWVGRYDLDVDRGDGIETVRVLAELIPPGRPLPQTSRGTVLVESLRLACSLDAPPALGLDAIDEFTDPGTGLALINAAIGDPGGRYEGFRAIAVEPAIVRLKPANRATVRLALRLPPNSPSVWPTTIYAKVYKGKKGVVAWRGMTALRDAEAGAGGFILAEPLAWLDDKRVLLQGAVVGDRDLKNVLRAGVRSGEAAALLELDQTMRKVGHAMAGIHRCGATAGAPVHWQDELTERREEVDELSPLLEGAGIVEAAREAVRFLDDLASLDARHPPDRSVPAHGSFRPGQVLLGGGKVALIDWDGYCQAEPARDVGLFVTEVRSLATDAGGPNAAAEGDRLAAAFLAAYRERAEVSAARVALWAALEGFGKVLNCWTKVKPTRLPSELRELDRLLKHEHAVFA